MTETQAAARIELPVEFLFTLRLDGAAAAEHEFTTCWGTSRDTRMRAGRFSGPRLSGEVVPGLANDWGATAADGTIGIDAALVLRTDGGDAIYMAFYGRRTPAGKIRIAPSFEASAGPNAWLTEVMTIGRGAPQGADLVFDIFAIR